MLLCILNASVLWPSWSFPAEWQLVYMSFVRRNLQSQTLAFLQSGMIWHAWIKSLNCSVLSNFLNAIFHKGSQSSICGIKWISHVWNIELMSINVYFYYFIHRAQNQCMCYVMIKSDPSLPVCRFIYCTWKNLIQMSERASRNRSFSASSLK